MSTSFTEPSLSREPGWSDLNFPFAAGFGPCYVSGDHDGRRLRVRYFRRDEDGALVGKAWFGPGTEGPPGHAHGGSVSALLDEAMGFSAWLAGHMVLAAQLTINFRQMLPLGSEVRLEAWVEVVNGRKVTTRGRLVSPDGLEFADGGALFLKLDAERFNLPRKSEPQPPF